MNSGWPAVVGTVAGFHRSSPPPAQGAWGGVRWRRPLTATVRSFGDRRSGVLLAGASGGTAAGAGEEASSGESRTALEDWELASDGRKSNRGGRGSGGGEELPVFASGACSRPQQSRSWPAMVVRLQRWLPATRGGWDPLRGCSWCFLSDRTRASKLGEESGAFGCRGHCRRWGEVVAARPAKRSLLRGCWKAGE